MSEDFDRFLAQSQQRCQRALSHLLGEPASEFTPTTVALDHLFAASQYSLSGGGKCIRASLVYSAAAISPDSGPVIEEESIDYLACAVEMIHAYSLVHDDLPAMDDDDLRRGKPSCHKAYDEATADGWGDREGIMLAAWRASQTARK